MGYTSSGAVRIRGPREAMLAQLVALKLTDPDQVHLTEALKACRLVEYPLDKNLLMLGWEINGKWYEGYPDVAAFMRIWEHFEKQADLAGEEGKLEDFDGKYLRIGEDDNDTEQRWFGDDTWELVEYLRTYEALPLEGKNLLETET